MKKKTILAATIVIIVLLIISGCIEKKERWTIDNRGIGKDTYYEPSNDTPGFELPLLLIAFIGVSLMIRRRKI